MGAEETSEWNPSRQEGQEAGVFCTRLESLQSEGIHPTLKLEVVPILKDNIILQAIISFPSPFIVSSIQFQGIGTQLGEMGALLWKRFQLGPSANSQILNSTT